MPQSQVLFQAMELNIPALHSHYKRMMKGNFLTASWTIDSFQIWRLRYNFCTCVNVWNEAVVVTVVIPSPIASNIAEKFRRGGRGFPLRVFVNGPVAIGMLKCARWSEKK